MKTEGWRLKRIQRKREKRRTRLFRHAQIVRDRLHERQKEREQKKAKTTRAKIRIEAAMIRDRQEAYKRGNL